MSGQKNQSGFSLIELLIAVTILAVLATAVMPFVGLVATRNKEDELRLALRQIRMAIDAYKQATDEGRIPKSIDASGYPPSLQELVQGVKDVKDPNGKKIYFLRRVPRDPFCDCPGVNNDNTWLKRSYASPPDNPAEGADVFDVLSRSQAVGLNGVPYREW